MIGLYSFNSFQRLENVTVDLRFSLRGPRPVHPDIAIVTVDQKSVDQMGRWPFPRSDHGRLVDFLTAAGAKAVVFDVLFTEADRDFPAKDAALGRAAAKSGRTTLGLLFHRDEKGGLNKPLLPIPALEDPSTAIGFVNMFPESDGVLRMAPLYRDFNGTAIPSLPVAALAAERKKTPEELVSALRVSPLGDWNEVLINFSGWASAPPYTPFPYYSFADVLDGRVPAKSFHDKWVLVGGTLIGAFDYKAVPNDQNFPGLEIQANVLDNLLSNRFLNPVPTAMTWLLMLLFGLGLGRGLAALKAWTGATVLLAAVAGYFGFCQWLFTEHNLLLDFVAPSATLTTVYVAMMFRRLLAEEKEKRRIKTMFAQYASPTLIEILIRDPSKLKLGGEEKEVSIFFSDIAGFTTLSEQIPPAQLVNVLNEYLTDMTNVIIKHDGYLDKYIGDAIMALWNALVDQPRHAVLACRAAVAQLHALDQLQKRFREKGWPPLDCRMGLNTGRVVVGNMGSLSSFDFTAVGDSVNLASRLEGANKMFGTHILISESTYRAAQDEIEARELDFLRVKGKTQPIRVYELLGLRNTISPEKRQTAALFAEGLAYYREQRFDLAAGKFMAALVITPNDPPSALFTKRSREFLLTPPPRDWDGVYVMTSK